MIKLYHGSNVRIESIDLSRSKKGKDFGCGFYLNADKLQAWTMAQRTTRTLGCGAPVLSAFWFDEQAAESSELKIKVFPEYSEEWAEFVVMNRRNASENQAHNYDIVVGPIADDTVGVQIRRYVMGYMSVADLVKELRYHGDHAVQYFFWTQKAVDILKPEEDL